MAFKYLTLNNAWVEAGEENITFLKNRKIVLTTSTTGGVTRMIELRTETELDRNWIVWRDHTRDGTYPDGRTHTALGWHHTDSSSGQVHNAFEIKTTAADLVDLRTRLSIGTDADQVLAGFNYVTFVEANQGEAANAVDFGFRLRGYLQDGTSNGTIGQLIARADSSDNVVVSLDAMPVVAGATKSVTLQIFRNTNTGSGSNPVIAVKKGDGTNTNALLFTARTGKFELLLAASSTTGIILGGDSVATLYRNAASTIKTDGNIVTVGAVGTKVKAGTPADADVTTPVDGMIVADSTGNKIWVRLGGVWKGVAVA